MEDTTLLKKIADFTLAATTILGVSLAIINLSSFKIKGSDILTITAAFLFVIFIFLITQHVSKIERRVKRMDDNFKIIERLNKLELKVFKR